MASADGARLMVRAREVTLERVANRHGFFRLPLFAQQRIDRDLGRRESRIEPQHDPLFILDYILVVRVEQKREHRAIDAKRRLDHPGAIARLPVLVEVGKVLAAEFRVLIEVEAAALGDTLQLATSTRVLKL